EKTSAFEEMVTKYLSKLPVMEQERLTKEKNELVQKRNMFLAIPKKPGQTGSAAKNLVKDLKITFKK
ncbi:MAG: hypothetical protein M1549_00550, partial [Candidatus Dependentiae bacterium]|nr:hypothetical protein [Candidatus Dependentiae bacterium]